MKLEIEKSPTEESTQPLNYVPRTPLGEKLLAIRARIIATGGKLLDRDEIENEIADCRGEHHDQTV